MYSNKLKSPVVACALLGVAALSFIAYHFYTKNKKKSFLERLKKFYNDDNELFPNENLSDEEPYDTVDPSDLSDYLLVEPSDSVNRNNHLLDEDRYMKYDKLQEVAYIEDLSRDGRPNKGYKILANPQFFKSASTSASSRQLSNQSDKYNKERLSRRPKKEKQESYEGWTVLDNFTNYDGCAEELTYVEKTVLDLEENEPVQIKDHGATTKSLENKCCTMDSYKNNNCCNNNSHLTNTNSNNEENENIINDNRDNAKDNMKYLENNKDNMDLNNNNTTDKDLCYIDNCQINNPETVKIYMKNFGCSHNISDSEYMLGLLDEYGYKIVNNMNESNLVIINSCTVKGPSEEGMVTQIKLARKLNLPVIVSGCVPQADKNNNIFNESKISLLGVTQIDRIVEMVENSLTGRKMILLEKKELPKLDLPKIRKDKLIEIIPLSTGCLGSCTFCKTKYSRGVLGSYDIEVILDRVENSLNEGIKEIWLTSEDLGAYGIDIGTDIITLLNSIISIIPKDIMIRLGMSNPPYIKKHINDICEILKNDNVYEFIHIPVQSFSNKVLDKMNREYNVEDFIYLIDIIRNKIPNCTIATDIISGFPTETNEDHLITKNMLEKLKIPIVNISQFYPRKGTIASKMKQLKNKIGKNRSREITEIFMSYETNSKYVGKELNVYFNHINDRKQLVGHNKQYIKVILIINNNNENKDNNINHNNIEYNNIHTNDDEYKSTLKDKDTHTTYTNNINIEEDNKRNIRQSNKENKNNKEEINNNATHNYYNIIEKYYGTVQKVKIINSTKWHLEGILV